MSRRKDGHVVDYRAPVRRRKSGWATPSARLIALTIVLAFVLLVILLLDIMFIHHGSIGVSSDVWTVRYRLQCNYI